MAYLGGGSGAKVNYNRIRTTGNNTVYQHSIYIASGITSYNVEIIGNDIQGQYGDSCVGAVISNHAAVDGFLVKNNLISIDADKATAGCYGMASDNGTSDQRPNFFRNAVFSGNTIINGGAVSLSVTSCPYCVIENNVIINNWIGGWGVGIGITGVTRGQDDVSVANTIRNNTVWYGPNVTGTTRGIDVGAFGGEGTGHIIANNTVSSAQSAGAMNCYRHDLPLSSYAFVNNNHCYATGAYNFEYTRGSLSAWQAYATSYGFDSASITGVPLFVNAGTDFTPDTGSPLIGAGNNTNKATLDFTGTTRPNPPAIGAYEH